MKKKEPTMSRNTRHLRALINLMISGLFTLMTAGLGFASPEISLPLHVVAGESIDVQVTDPDMEHGPGTLKIVYRPGSTVEKLEEFPVPAITRNTTQPVSWTPSDPGIAKLTYRVGGTTAENQEERQEVSKLVGVKFAEPPLSGITVMILAGLFLFGGCWISFRLLNHSDENNS
jgi:hypothetical protein